MKVVIVMPAYRAERTLERTVAAIPPHTADDIILVDDASPDGTAALARSLGLTVIVHDRNRGYGGNQKTCYRAALAAGADIVVMVHPDFQYDPSFIPQLIAPIAAGTADAVFGSRMRTPGGARAGGMPRWKYVANIALTRIGNAVLRTTFSEFHSGFRAYSRHFLETAPVERNADGFVFDTEIIVQGKVFGLRMDEIPITTRYFPEASMIGFWRSVQYGIAFCTTLVRSLLHRAGLRRDQCFVPIEGSTRCVGCGEHRCQTIAPSTVGVTHGSSATARPYRITEHGDGHGTILQCTACNLQFVPADEVSAEDAAHLYRTQPIDREYLREEHARRTTARRALRMLRSLIGAGGGAPVALLDIGAGAGFFVDEATQHGFDARGIEPGAQWRAYAQQRFGDRMKCYDAECIVALPAASIDACTAWDVLEHVRDPVTLLTAVRRALVPGGIFACSVPVVDSIAARCMRRRWHGYVPAHLTYFTRATLLDTLTREGFTIVRTRWYVRYFSLQYLLSRLGVSIVTPFLSLVIPVQLYDTIEVYCKKS